MFAYITTDGIVGEMFETMPGADTFHPDFMARIIPVPEGVTSGWLCDWEAKAFSPAPEPPEPEAPPTSDELIDILLGRDTHG